MNPNDRPRTLSPDQLAEGLHDLAATRRIDYRDGLVLRTARTRQRPAWTFIERWLPMTLVSARTSTTPPHRAVWTLLLVGLLTAALLGSLAIVGSQLLRDPDSTVNALAPMLVDGAPIDSSAVPDLSVPSGIDVGPDGNLYVVNTGTHEILVLDPDGREVIRWGEKGTGAGQFLFHRNLTDPVDLFGGVAVGPDGSVYVADMVNDRVQQFTSQGAFVREWGGYGAEDGQFLEPFDIAAGPDGTVYVVDDIRDDIQRFTADGEWLQTIGRHGAADGEMDFTGGIGVDANGMLLNADFGNQRFQAWDETGAFIESRGGVTDPSDVVTDLDGRVYVADAVGLKLFDDGAEPVSVSTPAGWFAAYLASADDGTIYASIPGADRIDRMTITYREAEVASESPQADASPAATDAASPDQVTAAPVAGGPELVSVGSVFPVPFSAELPSSTVDRTSGQSGWWLSEELPGYASFQYVRDAEVTPAYVTIYLPAGVFRDPCQPDDGMLTTSDHPSVDELVEALTNQVGVRAGAVSDVQLGRHQAKLFELDNNIDVSQCSDDPWLHHWTFRSEGLDGDAVGRSEGLSGTHQRIAIVDVDGTPVLIEAWHLGARVDEVLEANAVLGSIRFE